MSAEIPVAETIEMLWTRIQLLEQLLLSERNRNVRLVRDNDRLRAAEAQK